MPGYQMNFNQDFTSASVLNSAGFRLFAINSVENVDEIFSKEIAKNEEIRIVERLFNSSLVVLVTTQKPNCLKMLHFKKKQDICNCVYPSDVLCVRMNRSRLVVCLAESIHIHDIRDMKILHSIDNIPPNNLGLCSLSLNSYLAFPTSNITGELRIFNAGKLRSGLTLKAHDSPLSAICFSPSGTLLATASERGTVIRVFCVRNGQRIQEFRRGMKRFVRIASLVFSPNGDYLCVSSNTETVHIFKIDSSAVEAVERKYLMESAAVVSSKTSAKENSDIQNALHTDTLNDANKSSGSDPLSCSSPSTADWLFGNISKVSSYLIPSQVSDVLSQDRAFGTVMLPNSGLKHICGLARIQKQLKVLVAVEDGFLYIYDLDVENGGTCKQSQVHDLRMMDDNMIELNLNDSLDKLQDISNPPSPSRKEVKTNQVLIENPEPETTPDKSYAGILKGPDATSNVLTDSAKFRKLCDAIDTPTKLYDERQFPPVAIAAHD